MDVNKKICLINQPAGIGDVLFLQKMVSFYIEKGFFVVFPLIEEILYIKDYVKNPNLMFCGVNENFPYKDQYWNTVKFFESDNFIYVPATFADRFIVGSCMEAKYKLINLGFEDWKNYFNFERNHEKENNLYYNVLNLKDDDEYCFINKRWGTPPHMLTKDVHFEFSGKVIEMNLLDGYTVFDWCKVIENANQISIVDTSLNYIIEKLNLKSQKNFLNSRFTPPNFIHIINLFQKNWSYLN